MRKHGERNARNGPRLVNDVVGASDSVPLDMTAYCSISCTCVYCGGYMYTYGRGDPGLRDHPSHPSGPRPHCRPCICRDGCRLAVSEVDVLPGVKESKKSFIQCQTRIIILLHYQDFVAYNHYVNRLLQKHPSDPDFRILAAVYEAESKVIQKHHAAATRCLAGIEKNLRQDSLSHRMALTASYLTTKGKLLELEGNKKEALSIYEEALEVSLLGQSRCHETPYLLFCCGYRKAHGRDSNGTIELPSERTWSLIENMKRRACEQHAALKDIMAEDHAAGGRSINFFFTWKPVEYVCTLLRSCLLVGFIFFDQMTCPVSNLPKAHALIKKLQKDSGFMTPRTRILFRLFRCDYQLRIAEYYESRSLSAWQKAILRAKKHVEAARELTRFCQAYPHSHEVACELRFFYIQQKLCRAENMDWATNLILSSRTRDWVSRILRNSVVKKTPSCEAFPTPDHSVESSLSDPSLSPDGYYDRNQTLVKRPEQFAGDTLSGVRSECPYGNKAAREGNTDFELNLEVVDPDETPRKC